MGSKFRCPYCFLEHEIKECGLKCSYNVRGTAVKICKNGVEKDDDGWIPHNSKGKCMKCQDATKHYYCDTIDKEIPSGFLMGESLSIAMLGAKASGKSNYIAVLINEIREKMTSSFDCTLDISCSEESKKYYDDYYYSPLFKQGYVVEATDGGEIPPLIFPLRFAKKGFFSSPKVATLTFYDTAGENLESNENVEIYNRYIPNADGIILLLDPLQVPAIRKKLQGKMDLPPENKDAAEILNRVIQNIRNVKNIKGMIDIPLALVFTKIDALEKFDILPEYSPLRDESEHLRRGIFVIPDFENTNAAMQDILENWLGGELEQMAKQFSKYSFFGITSFGNVPNGTKLSSDIAPRRVLDPLLWLLAEKKYIDKAKK
ncbi:MAG: GTPase domain-containing protein [Clostridia bacterium]|nr:GTPase domain-containing protein [Clostridia bacterium]MBQ7788614.1 GTPase domain-containing protein [Clostridia bacterium]